MTGKELIGFSYYIAVLHSIKAGDSDDEIAGKVTAILQTMRQHLNSLSDKDMMDGLKLGETVFQAAEDIAKGENAFEGFDKFKGTNN